MRIKHEYPNLCFSHICTFQSESSTTQIRIVKVNVKVKVDNKLCPH